MLNPSNPEDLRAMLLHMAAASAGAPKGRVKVARMLRAALALVEDDEPEPPPVIGVSEVQARALSALATTLHVAAEQAEFLAEKAGVMWASRP